MTRMESHARRQTTDRAMMIDESERRPHSVNIITFTRVFIRTPFLPPFLSLSLSLFPSLFLLSQRSTGTIAGRRFEILMNNNNVTRVNAVWDGSADRGFSFRSRPLSRTKIIRFPSSRVASFMVYVVGHRMRRSNPRNEIPEPTLSRRDPPGHKTLRDPGRSRSPYIGKGLDLGRIAA